ncbi:MAG: TIGR00730 family Rossman fold protein [Parcubacteria group bacterium]|nr:TIGR00730 family Rossman fold protein [Parcubacteria group bacterium]
MSRLHKNKEYYANVERTVDKVREEINNGLALLNKIDKPIVTFFGSHRVAPDSKYYQHAKQTACELGKNGYAILSGGGPGIMHASNAGATDAQAPSLGLKAELLTKERITDPIFTHELSFHFIFARRFIMSIKSEALIFYPGGYGTLNELFEYAVLMQIGIVDTVPIICVNKPFWSGLFDWLKENPLKEDFFINDIRDLKLLHFAEDSGDILRLIKENR